MANRLTAPPLPDRLREAYDRTHARVWRALLAWSGSRDVADEAAAEAFAQAARRVDSLRDIDAWVWRAAFRIAAGELQQRRRSLPLDETRVRHVASQDLADVATAGVDLIAALHHLTPQQRACVVMRELADLSTADVARALGTSSGNVRVQLFNSRRALRHLLEVHDA